LVPPQEEQRGDVIEVELAGGEARARSSEGVTVLPPAQAAAWRERRDIVERFFTRDDGFGAVQRINVLDGVRVWFESGDVAHIRPSGNAPQLRIYANADSQARADQIVALGLREP